MSRYSWGTGGRYSPFAAQGGPTPRVTEADFDYLDEGHPDAPRHYRNGSYGFPAASRHSSRTETSNLSPDILILKHKGTTYPLHFPAFDISEGILRVGDVRYRAAKETKIDDPRRVKLLYKGKSLRDDHRPCKDEGLKQNSELLCIVNSEPISRDDGHESSSSASSEMIANGIDTGPRIDVDGTIIDRGEPRKRKGHRGGRKRKGRDASGSEMTSPGDSGFLAPPNGTSSTSRAPSPDRRAPSPAPPPPQQQQSHQPPKKPTTPSEMLDAMADTFSTQFLPQVRQYISHPPNDPKTRDFEYKKLSESILTQILMKLDSIESGGVEEIKSRRKEQVRGVQDWLTDLDRASKRSGGM